MFLSLVGGYKIVKFINWFIFLLFVEGCLADSGKNLYFIRNFVRNKKRSIRIFTNN